MAATSGTEAGRSPQARRAAGCARLYKRLTARENIEYFGRLHGSTRPTLKARAMR
jgi:ABC-type Na+ transport system ATPase subunit NatA